jgi:hypothetical protein
LDEHRLTGSLHPLQQQSTPAAEFGKTATFFFPWLASGHGGEDLKAYLYH